MDCNPSLTRKILDFRLCPLRDAHQESSFFHQIFSDCHVYALADPADSEKEWTANAFDASLTSQTITLYTDKSSAEFAAAQRSITMPGMVPNVTKLSDKEALFLVANYMKKSLINKVCICGRPPIHVELQASSLIDNLQDDFIFSTDHSSATRITAAKQTLQQSTHSTVNCPQDCKVEPPPVTKTLILIDEVKQVLDTPSAAERRKLDPGNCYGSFSKLMERLISANQINTDELDKAFHLPPGFTHMVCRNQKGDNIPKAIMQQYLHFFDLEKYLYAFKSQCKEVSEELKTHPHQIDRYTIKKTTPKTGERFQLESIKVAIHKENNAYIYQLTFHGQEYDNESKRRVVSILSSSHYNMIIGKEYEIVGLEPHNEDIQKRPRDAAVSTAKYSATEDDEHDILEKLKADDKKPLHDPTQKVLSQEELSKKRYSGKGRYIEETPEERLEKDRNTILAYIIRTEGCNTQEAKRKMEPFDDNPDAIMSFALYLSTKKAGKYASHGYTPKTLMTQLHYSPLEAFCIMAQLDADPKHTLQQLKYRRTDPQYQKPSVG